ncbi:IPT/TIG domain-containing protein [Cesiribacter sp. SM1]|uniref:IPT/TIG domain-containing protein n=1 Tax=Cesiribacter sp. SM1 TaxID=2861196 RepID=UPI001CD6FB98|nr:IPT/TIG domain-containing protein [Cesiribacter sp. SM1]
MTSANPIHIFSLLIILCLFSGCAKDKDFPIKKSYPLIRTEAPVSTDGKAVMLSAKLLSEGNQQITDYGFIWEGNGITFQYSLFNSKSLQEFELLVDSDLEKGVEYSCRAFVKTTEVLVLGNSLNFSSEGTEKPVILDFFPKSGGTGDTITVIGKHFSINRNRNKALLGNDSAYIISADFDTVKVMVPVSITKSGGVKITIGSGSTMVVSRDEFIIDGHRVTSISPRRGIIGETELTIYGTGFDPRITHNKVMIGGQHAFVLEAEPTQLRIRLPYDLQVGNLPVSVTVRNQEYTHAETVEIISRWRKLNPFPGQVRVAGYFTIINGMGYHIGGADLYCCNNTFADVWQYNFDTDSWKQLNDFPGRGRDDAMGFYLGGKLYYGTGSQQRYVDIWEYTPELDQWKQLSDFPGAPRKGSAAFTSGNYGYLISGSTSVSHSNEIWRYMPLTDTWEIVGRTTIFRMFDSRDTHFTYNGEGYIIPFNFSATAPVKLYKFNPWVKDYFEAVTTVPFDISSNSQPAISFVLNDVLYIGGATYGSAAEPKVWTYHFKTGEWKRIENFRGGITTMKKSFSYKNKGYVGFMVNETEGFREFSPDIWVYDPEIQ